MSKRISGIGFFLLIASHLTFSQEVTSPIIVTSRSLAVEPATNNSAFPGGITTFLTTYDGGNGLPLFPFSGEAKPIFPGSSDYVTDYEGHLGILDPNGPRVNYGEIVISNMPVGMDADGDSLPDFSEISQSGTFTTTGADREDWRYDDQPGNSSWIFSFTHVSISGSRSSNTEIPLFFCVLSIP